jgi:hypothetical protein
MASVGRAHGVPPKHHVMGPTTRRAVPVPRRLPWGGGINCPAPSWSLFSPLLLPAIRASIRRKEGGVRGEGVPTLRLPLRPSSSFIAHPNVAAMSLWRSSIMSGEKIRILKERGLLPGDSSSRPVASEIFLGSTPSSADRVLSSRLWHAGSWVPSLGPARVRHRSPLASYGRADSARCLLSPYARGS